MPAVAKTFSADWTPGPHDVLVSGVPPGTTMEELVKFLTGQPTPNVIGANATTQYGQPTLPGWPADYWIISREFKGDVGAMVRRTAKKNGGEGERHLAGWDRVIQLRFYTATSHAGINQMIAQRDGLPNAAAPTNGGDEQTQASKAAEEPVIRTKTDHAMAAASSTTDASDSSKAIVPRPRATGGNALQKTVLGSRRYMNEPLQPLASEPKRLMPRGGNTAFDMSHVLANYVQIRAWPKTIFEYSIGYGQVEFEDKEGHLKKRRISKIRVKKAIIDTLSEHDPLRGTRWATDYSTIWSLDQLKGLDDKDNGVAFGPVQYYTNSGKLESNAPMITLKYLRRLELPVPGPGSAFRLPPDYAHRERIVTAMNAFVNTYVTATANQNNVLQVAPNKFFVKNAWAELGQQDLLVYRGFSTSVRPTADRLLLGIAPLCSAFLRPVTVREWIRHLTQQYSLEDAMKTLINVRCRLLHNRIQYDPMVNPNLEENRFKVITEFGRSVLGQNQQDFNSTTGVTTVQDHFADLILQNPNLFRDSLAVNVGLKLIWTGAGNEASKVHRRGRRSDYESTTSALWIPDVLLEIEPYQLYTKLLTGPRTQQMIQFACKDPAFNRGWIEDPGLRFLGIRPLANPNWLQGLDLAIHDQLVKVPVTEIAAPFITFGGNHVKKAGSELGDIRDADWNLRDVPFNQAPAVDSLQIYRVNPVGNAFAGSRQIYSAFSRALRSHGFGNAPQIINQNRADVNVALNLGHQQPPLMTQITPHFPAKAAGAANHLAIIVLPDDNPLVFGAVKRACDDIGLHNICVLHGNTAGQRDPSPQYVSNLCLKINAKFGRLVHRVSYFDRLDTGNTLVLGADIGKLKGGDLGTPKVAAVVGTVDANMMNMPGSMRPIAADLDIIPKDIMKDMVKERIRAWSRRNQNRMPSNILMYRDGVSQSQYQALLNDSDQGEKGELPAIREACSELKSELRSTISTKITFVVVGKRHNTRFFPNQNNQAIRNGNLKPGYLVDDVVTLANEGPVKHNFFLQSHKTIQGTARTGHYIVLENEMQISNKVLQEVTYGFCYAYVRATKGVSYCAPAYNADRLCYRGEYYLRRVVEQCKTSPWWGMAPAQQPGQPDPIPDWFRQIAENVATHPSWLGVGAPAGRRNPWNARLDGGMFWV